MSSVHHSAPVALCCEHRASLKNGARSLGLRHTDSTALTGIDFRTPLLASIEIEERNRMPESRVAGNSSATAVFRIAGMPTRYDDLQLALRRIGNSLR